MAIYEGGQAWQMDGELQPALNQETFYIVPDKCTECVGFFGREQCATVCPVDCCIADPDNVEREAELLARARRLHPDLEIGADFPSRFRN